MTDEIDLDELRKLANAATPGPWEYHPKVLGLPNNTVNAGCAVSIAPNDAAYIAAANPAVILPGPVEPEIASHIPESWDGDEAQIAIILRFVQHYGRYESARRNRREELIRVIAASAANDQGLKMIRDDQRTADAVLAWIDAEREGVRA